MAKNTRGQSCLTIYQLTVLGLCLNMEIYFAICYRYKVSLVNNMQVYNKMKLIYYILFLQFHWMWLFHIAFRNEINITLSLAHVTFFTR